MLGFVLALQIGFKAQQKEKQKTNSFIINDQRLTTNTEGCTTEGKFKNL
jgi:hypothetical protein